MSMLLEQFDSIFDTPESIDKLKELILDMAVKGNLVLQDENDEPASVLLEKILGEKERLIKEQKIKRVKPLPLIKEEENPYELPKGWEWVRIIDICSVKGGKRVPRGYQLLDTPTEHAYIRITNMKKGTILLDNIKYIDNTIFEKISRYVIYKEDLYITIAGTIGGVGLIPKELDGMNLTENAARIINCGANKCYLYRCFSSKLVQDQFLSFVNQMAQPKLALKRIETTLIPLPPLNEQKRIVEKVDQLMDFCEKLKERVEKKKKREDRLNVSALSSLEQSITSEELKESLQFVLNNLSVLCTDTKHVQQLRNVILALAVKGKLVLQDENDEPASVLLERIAGSQEEIRKDQKQKIMQPFIKDKKDKASYELPAGWIWVKLASIISEPIRNGYSPKGVEYVTKVKNLTLTATSSGYLKKECFKYIDQEIDEVSHLWLEKGDILVQRSNSLELVGTSCIYDIEDKGYIYPDLMMKIKLSKNIDKKYIHFVLSSQMTKSYFRDNATGTSKSMPKINQKVLSDTLIPLPPLNEQKRIVEKIDQFMSLCDEIEKQIENINEQKECLLQSVLRQEFQQQVREIIKA
ncbi:restriction endonuclease subunit S [Bacillus paranthracis]|uniref:restriction endonuclease subunit S n=1 Tax=Bacillus TaxID=1386 RepID=UPI000771D9C1|nr:MULTISPECIES: restriction endonuclease subunit S [Bacillus]KXI53130.1 hypothetical protein ACS45_08800 [Bacillus cereus]KAB7634872.1 hypothetical protein GBN96_18940 [Bacillus sp. B4-WWTP-NA-D-NA-NA]MCZ7523360.1 restriction endonuclease subunit S [Bacillus pacificus]MDA1574736.1 restriction endonuclease subunit S [Bacillus cereus group sp. TH242-3LC]RRB00244.1 hypothetical protein EH195_18950 [Bacillus pacificus]